MGAENGIGDDGAEALGHALEKNTALKTLKLVGRYCHSLCARETVLAQLRQSVPVSIVLFVHIRLLSVSVVSRLLTRTLFWSSCFAVNATDASTRCALITQ